MATKVIVKKSTIPSIGKGLFATVDIPKGSIITEFKGKLKKLGDPMSDNRSNISFSDDYILDCPKTDLASFANDAIIFTRERRFLLSSLQSSEPFYKKYPNTTVNSEISLNNKLHRAFLKANKNIKAGEEIFTHYGFPYWFKTEIMTVGFLQEEEIEKNGFPEKVFTYPSFKSYIEEFYPTSTKYEIKTYKDFFDIIIHLSDGQLVLIPMDNYAKHMKRVDPTTMLEI